MAMNFSRSPPAQAAVETFHPEYANHALDRLRNGSIRGAAVLVMEQVRCIVAHRRLLNP